MRRLFLILLVVVVPFVVFSQQVNYKDIVELKNGSIIKGIIIEQIPNKQIKMQTGDGNIFVFEMDQISKIKKELVKNTPPAQSDNNHDTVKKEELNQDNSGNKGYIGISLGAAIPTGDAADIFTTGASIAIFDFGYYFSQNIGIAGKIFGNIYTGNKQDITVGEFYKEATKLTVGGIMGGLTVVIPASHQLEFLARGLIGVGKGQATVKTVDVFGVHTETIESDPEFSYDLGVGLKFNVGQHTAVLANFDYIGVKDYNSINITAGIAYRF